MEPPYTEPYVRWCESRGLITPSYSIGVRMGKVWERYGEARYCPPYAHARGRKGGRRMGEVWEKPCSAHLMPGKIGERRKRVGEVWARKNQSTNHDKTPLV